MKDRFLIIHRSGFSATSSYSILCYYITEVNVGFVPSSYSVEEDANFVTVCMVISGLATPTRSDLCVDLSTVDGDATGKLLDRGLIL